MASSTALTGGFKTTSDLGTGFFFGTILEKMILVKSPDHTDFVPDPSFGFSQVHVGAHPRRCKGLHGIGFHGCNIFQDGHHATAGMVADPLPGLMGCLDKGSIVGRHIIIKYTG
mgnify:CR=1 FL=1